MADEGTRAPTPAEIRAQQIVASGEDREDHQIFLGVYDSSRFRLPYISAKGRAIADAVVELLRIHDKKKHIKVTIDSYCLTVEGPITVFDDAQEAARGRAKG